MIAYSSDLILSSIINILCFAAGLSMKLAIAIDGTLIILGCMFVLWIF